MLLPTNNLEPSPEPRLAHRVWKRSSMNTASAARPGLCSQACHVEGTQVSCTHLSLGTTWKELFSTAAVLPRLRQSSTHGLETRGFSLNGCGQQFVNPLQRKQFKDTTTKSFKEQRKPFTQSVISLRSPSQRSWKILSQADTMALDPFPFQPVLLLHEEWTQRGHKVVEASLLGRDESCVCVAAVLSVRKELRLALC